MGCPNWSYVYLHPSYTLSFLSSGGSYSLWITWNHYAGPSNMVLTAVLILGAISQTLANINHALARHHHRAQTGYAELICVHLPGPGCCETLQSGAAKTRRRQQWKSGRPNGHHHIPYECRKFSTLTQSFCYSTPHGILGATGPCSHTSSLAWPGS